MTYDDASALYSDNHLRCVITSFGENHTDNPTGDALLVDTRALRNPPEDPAVRERMLNSNGLDREVRHYVMATRGARELVSRNAEKALILLDPKNQKRWVGTAQPTRVDIHVMCGGGRHRSVAIAEEIAAYLRAADVGCEVEHRHIDRPITTKPTTATAAPAFARYTLEPGHIDVGVYGWELKGIRPDGDAISEIHEAFTRDEAADAVAARSWADQLIGAPQDWRHVRERGFDRWEAGTL
ncbi:RapZ C-terminal domain-containing protein [Streptomyces showdoensis]|uniref:RapZ C-terminal domain-containing protein n=1 Tax=Streptomyces showdoensis TaxID=68268 RepID=UPI000F516AFB|nr:RNase adapter RapZ [Streptomyces showdoensis]